MKKGRFILFAVALFSCHQRIYYANSDLKLIHSKAGYEDYRAFGIDKLYYPSDTTAYFRSWTIYKDQSKANILAKCEKKKERYFVKNYWENGRIKEIKNYDHKRSDLGWTWYCENGVKVFSTKGLGFSVDTIYYCNGKYQYLFNQNNEIAIYFDENGDTTMYGRCKDIYKREGLWVNKQKIGYMKKYEIYTNGQKVYQGDSIPSWYHKLLIKE
jgi:hypothetical protein